jgi:glyoxylase-like metal-dependent hydrolase (beta-lactamase superfamily II)
MEVLLETLPVGPLQANCYVVGDPASHQGLVIDPGGDVPLILDTIRKHQLQIQRIVCTHGHFDHVLGVEPLRAALKVPFVIHRAEEEILKRAPDQAQQVLRQAASEAPVPDQWLDEGVHVSAGALELQVLHTPGHSPGSACLSGAGVVFTGDTLFAGSVGRTDNLAELLTSIRTKLLPLPDAIEVYPGHGPATTIGYERRSNPFVRRIA